MRLEIFRTLWGYTHGWPQAIAELREAGFDGLEARLPPDPALRAEYARLLAAEDVPYIATLFTAHDVLPDQSASPQVHLDDLQRKLGYAAELSPRLVNTLAGNDRWSLAAQVDFFGRALELAAAQELTCLFEIHRARSLYSPWVTLELIRQLPQLRFTTDISHWVVVCERLLDDPADDLTPFVERVQHIQARVGYDQGPQVPHPGAPEYSNALAFHQKHWEAVWRAQQARGQQITTLTPEFGPDGYLHHLPFTNAPIADLWALNRWMADEERRHFQRFLQSGF